MSSRDSVLRPIAVPWKISSSVGLLESKLELSSNDDRRLLLRLGVYYPETDWNRDRIVEVVLEQIQFLKWHSDIVFEDYHPLNAYDSQHIPEYRDSLGRLSLGQYEFYKEWKLSGICPDSSAYEVAPSQLIQEWTEPRREGLRHYVFVFDDSVVEAVSTGMTWRFEDDLAAQ